MHMRLFFILARHLTGHKQTKRAILVDFQQSNITCAQVNYVNNLSCPTLYPKDILLHFLSSFVLRMLIF